MRQLVGVLLFSILLIKGFSGKEISRQESTSFSGGAARKEWFGAPKVRLSEAQLAYFYSLGEYKPNIKEEVNNTYTYTSRSKRAIHSSPVKTRKEIRQLSTLERTKLFNAINDMKSTMIGGLSEYDIFVALHRGVDAPSAHFGAGFLPWHREYLWRFERALQAHDPTVALAYWDSTLDQKLPEPKDSFLWSSTLLGNNNGPVTSGAFGGWSGADVPGCSGTLNRYASSAPVAHSYLFDDSEIQYVLSQNEFSDITSYTGSPAGKFENDHGGPHVFVGGQMGSITCSPSDPVFWMHHAFVDCTWESFRQTSQTTPKELEYPTTAVDGSIGGSAHEPFSPMEPFSGVFNIHGLSNHYTNYYYQCAPRPHTCESNSECGSPYLWCDTTDCKCKAKIRVGGDCTGFSGGNPCYGLSQCISNVCTFPIVFTKPWHTLHSLHSLHTLKPLKPLKG